MPRKPENVIYENIIDTMGGTPLVRINRLVPRDHATVLVKCEFFNPLSSVKDRIGVAMIEAAERAGKIDKDTVIVEPTSGNTGIALAFVCAARGYRLILTMPESMSLERRRLLRALGAEVSLTSAADGMQGSIEKAQQILREHKTGFMTKNLNINIIDEVMLIQDEESFEWAKRLHKEEGIFAGISSGAAMSAAAKVAARPENKGKVIVAVLPSIGERYLSTPLFEQ